MYKNGPKWEMSVELVYSVRWALRRYICGTPIDFNRHLI